MSINALANAACARRLDLAPIGRVPTSLDEIARAGRSTPVDAPSLPGMLDSPQLPSTASTPAQTGAPAASIDTALNVLFGYMPTEVVTLYVAVLAAVQKREIATADWIAFWVFLVATPLVVWLVFGAKLKAASRPLPIAFRTWPLWEMVAATVSFAAWAFGLPHSPFSACPWYSAALSGLALVTASAVLGLLAPFFQRPLAS